VRCVSGADIGSRGSTVRAQLRDPGQALGVGGHLTARRRTRVGGYGLDVARTLDELAADLEVLPLAAAARAILPARELSPREARELSFGRPLEPVPGLVGTREVPGAAFAPDGGLVALLADERGRSRPVRALPPDWSGTRGDEVREVAGVERGEADALPA